MPERPNCRGASPVIVIYQQRLFIFMAKDHFIIMALENRTEIIIRPARESDAELIAELSRQTFYESFAPDNTEENMDKFMNDQFTKEKLIDEVKQPWHVFFLAYIENKPVGYVKLRDGVVPMQLDARSSLEIARIYSVKNMIGKGVGRKLMQTCHA